MFTRPGSDWNADGHGFSINSISVVYTGVNTTINFGDVILHPVGVEVVDLSRSSNFTTADYTVNWVTKTVTVTTWCSRWNWRHYRR